MNELEKLFKELVDQIRDLDWCCECEFYFTDDMFGCDRCHPFYGEDQIEDSTYVCKLKPCWNDTDNRPKLLIDRCADYHPDFKPCVLYQLKKQIGEGG